MSTICSAICKAMRVGDNTVGTSTNCSTVCGSGTKERAGMTSVRILGTAIWRSGTRNASNTWSTNCGTGVSRICTNGASSPRSSTTCRSTRPCGRTSTRGVGRVGGRSHQALGVVQLVSLLLPGPGCLLAPWGGMVRHFNHGHGDGHPLMSQP